MPNHDDGGASLPLNEPVVITCVYITGAAVEATPNIMRLVGWVTMPELGGSETNERRVAVRFAMPISAANKLRRDLHDVLKR